MDAQTPDSQYRKVELPPNKQGIDAYAYWFAQQSQDTQRNLIAQGLGPELREGDGNYTFEVKADHVAFSYEEEMAIDPPEGEPGRTYTDDEVQEVIRRVVMAMQLSESPDCLFQARCILIAFGIGDPPTETELAKQRECSRQFVSKKVKRIQQLFNLSPSQYMRSEAACKAYADAWQRNQAKRTIKPSKRPRSQATPSIQMDLIDTHSSPHQETHTAVKQNKLTHPPQGATPSPRGKKSIIKKGGDSGSLDTAL